MRFFKKATAVKAYGALPKPDRRLQMERRFVETGDERCPLACAWMRLDDDATAPVDEGDLAWPAVRRLLLAERRRRASLRCNMNRVRLGFAL